MSITRPVNFRPDLNPTQNRLFSMPTVGWRHRRQFIIFESSVANVAFQRKICSDWRLILLGIVLCWSSDLFIAGFPRYKIYPALAYAPYWCFHTLLAAHNFESDNSTCSENRLAAELGLWILARSFLASHYKSRANSWTSISVILNPLWTLLV